MKRWLLWMFSIAWAVGCASPETQLQPAPDARSLAGVGGAFDAEEDVRLEAIVEAWDGSPVDLRERLTPVMVRLQNESSRAILVRYDAFQVVGPSGTSTALLPFAGDEGAFEDVQFKYEADGFLLAPHLKPFYEQFGVWTGQFPQTELGERHPLLRSHDLPTKDMIVRALPEGVLAPRGEIVGFLYFPEVKRDGAGTRIELRYEVVDAETGAQLTTLTIPFVVEEQ